MYAVTVTLNRYHSYQLLGHFTFRPVSSVKCNKTDSPIQCAYLSAGICTLLAVRLPFITFYPSDWGQYQALASSASTQHLPYSCPRRQYSREQSKKEHLACRLTHLQVIQPDFTLGALLLGRLTLDSLIAPPHNPSEGEVAFSRRLIGTFWWRLDSIEAADLAPLGRKRVSR